MLAARADWRLSQAGGGRVSSPARKSAIAVAIWGAPRRGRWWPIAVQARRGRRAGPPPAGGSSDGDERVVGVGDQEHRLAYAPASEAGGRRVRDQSALLGEEAAPHRPVIVVRVAPDVPVDVLARGDGPPAQPGDGSEPGPGQPRSQPPRRHRAYLSGHRRGQQPVPAGQAARADTGQQYQRLDPPGRQRGHRQRDASAVGVADQHRPADAARIQFRHHGTSALANPPGRRGLAPYPGRSSATTFSSGGSRSVTCCQSEPEPGWPCSNTTSCLPTPAERRWPPTAIGPTAASCSASAKRAASAPARISPISRPFPAAAEFPEAVAPLVSQ